MPPEESRLLCVGAAQPRRPHNQSDESEPSPVAPGSEELARLAGSPWHGFIELEFPHGAEVHAGVFSVISAALGKRSHFSLRLEQTLCVTMAVEDDSPACHVQLDEIAAYLGEVLPNAAVTCAEIGHQERPAAQQLPQRPVLSIVAEGEVNRG